MVTTDRKKWFALALILAVQFMVILDVAIVNVALPSIQVDFGGFLLLGGRSADLLGRRRVFMVGPVIFTIGSLLCGLAWSDESLIAFRALQGLGAAIITPAALSILVATFAEGRDVRIRHPGLAPGVELCELEQVEQLAEEIGIVIAQHLTDT